MPTAQHRAQRTETRAELVYSVAFGPPELRRAACRRNHRRDETGSAENVARAHAIWRAVIRLTTSGAYRHRYHATRAEAGAMTKHGVIGLSLSLRAEAAEHGVRVTAVCPGVVDTPILDKGGPDDLPSPR